MTDREEARIILETLQHNQMPDNARAWLRKRYLKLLFGSFGKYP
jgi:hypothetical protein